MKFINVLQGWEAYKEVFSAEVTLSSTEISLITNLLKENIKATQDEETKTLLSEFSEIENMISEEENKVK